MQTVSANSNVLLFIISDQVNHMAGSETIKPAGEVATNSGNHRPNGGPAGTHPNSPPAVRPTMFEAAGQTAMHSEIDHLQGHYTAEDWDEVNRFLSHHPALVSLLLDAHAHLSDTFAEGRSVRLRLVPGYEEGEPSLLFADVLTTADPVIAFARMNRFEDDWWLGAMTPAEGLLHFSVEFA